MTAIGKRPLEPVEPLLSDLAAVGTNRWFVWPPDWAWFLAMFFSLFCHRWSFGFGSLLLSPLSCLVGYTSFPAISSTWLHRYYLNWTELGDAITEFNNEMPWTENWSFNLVILHDWHTISLFWYCAVALTQFCIVKSAIYIKVTWLDPYFCFQTRMTLILLCNTIGEILKIYAGSPCVFLRRKKVILVLSSRKLKPYRIHCCL